MIASSMSFFFANRALDLHSDRILALCRPSGETLHYDIEQNATGLALLRQPSQQLPRRLINRNIVAPV
jgi:hypothetical protein